MDRANNYRNNLPQSHSVVQYIWRKQVSKSLVINTLKEYQNKNECIPRYSAFLMFPSNNVQICLK